MQVAIALFPRNTALDAIGPYEVLQRVPSIDVVWVGKERGEVRSDNGMLGLICDATFEEVTDPDVLVFPGGIGTRTLIQDDEVLDWLGAIAENRAPRTPFWDGANSTLATLCAVEALSAARPRPVPRITGGREWVEAGR